VPLTWPTPLIDPRHPLASWFLLVSGLSFLGAYALPLLLCPLRWARCLRWTLPEGSVDLTIYLGRCVGGLALAVIVATLRAVSDPEAHRAIFDLIGCIGAIMVGIHVYGALRHVQPWTETAEIGLYACLACLAFALRSSLG
jgi:hypothetical protein